MNFANRTSHGKSEKKDHCTLRPSKKQKICEPIPNRYDLLLPDLGQTKFTVENFWSEGMLLQFLDESLKIFAGTELIVVNTTEVVAKLWQSMSHPAEGSALEQPRPDASNEEELLRLLRDWYLKSAPNGKLSAVEECCTSGTQDKTTACTSWKDTTAEVRGAHSYVHEDSSLATETTAHLSASSDSTGCIYSDVPLLDDIAPLSDDEVSEESIAQPSSPVNSSRIISVISKKRNANVSCKVAFAAMCDKAFSKPVNWEHRLVYRGFSNRRQADDELSHLMRLHCVGAFDEETMKLHAVDSLMKRYVWRPAIEQKPCIWKCVVFVVIAPFLSLILKEFDNYLTKGDKDDFAKLLTTSWEIIKKENTKVLPNDFSSFWGKTNASYMVRAGLFIVYICYLHYCGVINKMISPPDEAALVYDSGFYDLETLKELKESRLKEDPKFINTNLPHFEFDERDVQTANILKSFLVIAFDDGEAIPRGLERVFTMALYWYCNRNKILGLTSGPKEKYNDGEMEAHRVRRIYHLVSGIREETRKPRQPKAANSKC
eukprot:gene26484-32008_t